MKVGSEVIAILDRCTFGGPALTLPEQLDRRDYVAVNKVIEAAGGKWNRKARAHLFGGEAAGVIDRVILAGEVVSAKQALGFFETPPGVVARLIDLAELAAGLTVLEPSAGEGAIVKAIAPLVGAVVACEIDPGRAAALRRQGITCLHEGDFLALAPTISFDRVVMNPPFARRADIDHVRHALAFLKPGGRLVSVMAVGVTERVNRKAGDFRKLVADHGGFFEELPRDAFKPSGTGVATVIAVIPECAS
jgi:predicted RNA methylase